MSSVSISYAVRSLLRHRRRTILSVVGIGIGCMICLCLISFSRGESAMMKNATAESGTGHLRICPTPWLASRDNALRLTDWQALMTAASAMPEVAVATPHARIEALLGMGTRTAGVPMVGVDPVQEPRINRLVRRVAEGRYLSPDEADEVVIGAAVADRLDVTVGDDLLVTVSGADGEIHGAMLRVCGIVRTGSRDLDGGICHVRLADLERVTGFVGAGELSILLHDPDASEEVSAHLQSQLHESQSVVPWQVIMPELAAAVKMDATWTFLTIAVVLIVVFLGIASAQLAAVLERRREFAVLSGLGMPARKLLAIMLTEGAVLGGLGGLVSLAIGTPLVWLLAHYGIDFTALYGDVDMGVSDILVDPIIYGEMGWWLIPIAMGLSLTATVLSSLYPAWFAIRTDPADALRAGA